jgi:predicted extracellular nuclease
VVPSPKSLVLFLLLVLATLLLSMLAPAAGPASAGPSSMGSSLAPLTDDHLLLCEAVLTPSSDEFIEIANPTGSAVDLSDYYLSDDLDYALLPGQFGAGPAPTLDSSDFIARFPAGANIPPGGVLVVAFSGAGFQTTFGFAADFELLGTDPGTPDMLPAYAGSIGTTAGLTNGGENATLFYWDGMSDLVVDVDMTNLGTPTVANAIANKTGIAVDGPDGDTTPSIYGIDAYTMPQQASDPGTGVSTKRLALEAGNESTGGGNGITGDDETTELITTTWDSTYTTPDPGVCGAVPAARMILNEFVPKGTEWVELYNGGTAAQGLAGWYVTDTACGAPATTIPATTVNPGDFYVVASDAPGDNFSLSNDGDIVILCDATHHEVDRVGYGSMGAAPLAPFATSGPQYSAARPVDGVDTDDDAADWNVDPTPTQGAANDAPAVNLGSSLIINELNIFPATGNDFVELYNPTGSPISVSGWFIGDGDDMAVLNNGLVVPAGGWLAIEEAVDWTTEGTSGVDFGGTDVAYLFDTNRVRVDQLGYTAGPFINDCVARVPDAAGPNDGYDWASSGGDTTLFVRPCTLGATNGNLPPTIIINEIHADPDATNGDANGDGVVDGLQDEFVEIVNNSGAAVDMSGWTLSGGGGVVHTFPAGTIVPDNCSIVVFGGGTPSGDFGYAVVQTASTGGMLLDDGGDTVTLNDGTADVVSYTYGAEGGNDQSLTRDPDVTGADPLVLHSTAAGSGGALFSPGTQIDDTPFDGCLNVCGAPATFVHQVQGSGASSPILGNTVMVEGVVVADFQTVSTIRGFYLQEDDGDVDGDPATSEGIFIYDDFYNAGGVDVSVGDFVRVSGTVDEYFNLTQLDTLTSVQICPAGPTASAASLTLPLTNLPYPERLEGMLISLPQTLFVTENFNLGRGGLVSLSAGGRLMQPTNVVLPGPPAIALQEANNRNQIILDDGSTLQNPDPIIHPAPTGLTALDTLRGADTVTGLVGVLTESWSGWSGTDGYRLHPFGAVSFTPANDRPAAPPAVPGDVRVASFNVLNYFLTLDTGAAVCGPLLNQGCRGADSAVEFARQRDKIISAISTLDAHVVGLMEMENTTGVEPLQDLVAGLNAVLGAGTYAYVDTGVIGGDAIRVGLIYRPAVVTPVGAFAILDSTVDPTFDDSLHRPVLAQTFVENDTNARFTVAVNHLKSKGSCPSDPLDPNADQGDGQSCWNPARVAGATALANWLATDPTGSGDSDFLIIGDLNAYAMEDPITALKNAGYTDLVDLHAGPNAYSYVFFAQAGYLDHGLASFSMAAQVGGAAVWHINADEPSVLDYNVEFKSAGQVISLYDDGPYRASDHDPVIIGLALLPGPNILVDPLALTSSQPPDSQVTHTLTISNTGSDPLVWEIVEEAVMGAAGTERDMTAHQRAKQMLLSTGLLLIPDSSFDRVMAFDPLTGDLVDANFIPADTVHLASPNAAILSAGRDSVLVSDRTNDVVVEYDLDGNFIRIFAPAGGPNTAILDDPRGLALADNGHLLVATAAGGNADAVVEFDQDGNFVGQFIAAGAGGLDGPEGILRRAGDWLVSGAISDAVHRFDLSGGPLANLAAVDGFPRQIAEAGNGNVLVANYSGLDEGIIELTAAGVFVGRYDPLDTYKGVYELPNGNILITTLTGVHEIDRSGNLVETKLAGVNAWFIDLAMMPCSAPADIPWLSTSVISGTLPAGDGLSVDVVFDATGLAPGLHTGNLCLTSNDPDPGPGNGTDLVVVPVSLFVEEPAISLTKTVGLVPGVCAATSEISVLAGTDVYYCYEVSNSGNITLTLHDLTDSELGPIFTGLPYDLGPGASVDTVTAGLEISATINTTTTNSALWTAYNVGPADVVTATAEATVNAIPRLPAIDLAKTVGTDPGLCATTDSIEVDPETAVYYCYTVTNTGNVTLTLHDLADSALGVIFSGLAYGLGPGESVDTVTAGLEISATITQTTVNTATWTAYNAGPVDLAEATAAATVTVTGNEYSMFLPMIFLPVTGAAAPNAAAHVPAVAGPILGLGLVVLAHGRWGRKRA